MTQRSLALSLVLVSVLTGCGGGAKKPSSAPSSPTPSPVPCAPSGTGTTDLAKKPVAAAPKTPAPAVTTVTDIVCGTGAQAAVGSVVQVKYVGLLYATGKEFDSSWKVAPDNTFGVTVGTGVIPGFSTGIDGMRVGGRREVVIPASDGYGPRGYPPVIPPNAALIFLVDLVKVG